MRRELVAPALIRFLTEFSTSVSFSKDRKTIRTKNLVPICRGMTLSLLIPNSNVCSFVRVPISWLIFSNWHSFIFNSIKFGNLANWKADTSTIMNALVIYSYTVPYNVLSGLLFKINVRRLPSAAIGASSFVSRLLDKSNRSRLDSLSRSAGRVEILLTVNTQNVN